MKVESGKMSDLFSITINLIGQASSLTLKIIFESMMNMKKFYRIFFLVLIIGMCGVLKTGEISAQETKTVEAVNPGDDSNPVLTVRDSVLSYFYPVNGVISEIKENRVVVRLQGDKKFTRGVRFSVFREGRPFYHPVTKEPIGKYEEFIGKVEIDEAGEGMYICSIVSGRPEINDIVRITSSPVKIAFFQDKKADWSISEAFYNSLKDSGRFNFIESYTKTYDPKELSKTARDSGAEAALLLSTPVKDKNLFLNVRLFWSEDSEEFSAIEKMVDAGRVKELTSEDKFVSVISGGGLPWGSYELAGGKFIAMGDVDGTGERELVVSDGHTIRIYNYKKEPREVWSLKSNPQEEHLSVDVLDLNNNGRAEIFVTSLRNDSIINSFVLEYDPLEGYKKIVDKLPYALRVEGNTLLMQEFTTNKTFTGPVYKGIWKDGRYQTEKPFQLHDGIDIYGFTYVDWRNSGHPNLLAFDNNGFLNLYSGNKLIWRSKNSYGRFDLSFEKKTYSVENPEQKWFVKRRLITVNTERGQEVLAIRKVPYLSNVPGLGYTKAEAYSLWWEGNIMDETLILSGIKGTVTDYLVDGDKLFILARTDLFMVLKKTLSGDFERGSILYYYNLKGK